MITTVTAWLIVIGVTILASLVMWSMGRMEIGRRLEVIRKRFFCPITDREVEVDFLVRTGQTESLRGVERCSAFKEGEAIGCDKPCLHLPRVQIAPVLFRRPFSPTFLL